MKKFFTVTGLPRSGSSLLVNLIHSQNRDIATSSTSGLIDVLINTVDTWDNIATHQAYPTSGNYFNPEDVSYKKKLQVAKGIIESYHSEWDRPYVIDKNRIWLSKFSMLEGILGYIPKSIVCVRDLRDVLASLEKVYQSNKNLVLESQRQQNPLAFETLEGRLRVWTNEAEIVGRPYNLIKEALRSGYKDYMYFCEFERLTTTPNIVMEEIYEFLEIPFFEHDFDNIQQVFYENDRVWRGDYHKIRSKIEPVPPQWPKYLGKLADKYKNLEIW